MQELDKLGRIWFRGFFNKTTLKKIRANCSIGSAPGARLPWSESLSELFGPNSELATKVSALGVDKCPVRIVAFNKNQDANWSVPWHQDRVIAVKKRNQIHGYSNWVQKCGFWHCEAPISLLSRMVFVRIHVDRSDQLNGPLEVALESHKLGRIPVFESGAVAKNSEIETCLADPGDVLVVNALSLHRSLSAFNATNRLAFRVDYAPRHLLKNGLSWAIAN